MARPGFGEVARSHLPWLYSLARRLADDAAEDLVQECLLKAFRSYDTLRDVKAAPAWLRQILVNCCRDRLRHEQRLPREEPLDDLETHSLYRTLADEDPLPYSDSLHLDFLSAFGLEDVWAVLDRLPPLYRIPLVLVHMEGYTTREVASALAVPLGTLLSRLHRGRRLFERELWAYAQDQDLLTRMEGARP
jgi:RNA polymerase sigma-70 factor (ECF subfamily)